MPCSRLYFGAVNTFFRIEYLCFGDFPFVVKEEYSNATSQQEEYFIFFRVQMAVWAEVGSRFKGIEQAVDGIVQMLMKVVVQRSRGDCLARPVVSSNKASFMIFMRIIDYWRTNVQNKYWLVCHFSVHLQKPVNKTE